LPDIARDKDKMATGTILWQLAHGMVKSSNIHRLLEGRRRPGGERPEVCTGRRRNLEKERRSHKCFIPATGFSLKIHIKWIPDSGYILYAHIIIGN